MLEYLSPTVGKPHNNTLPLPVNAIMTMRATPEALSARLQARCSQHTHVDGLDTYIYEFALRKLINETEGSQVYDRYQEYTTYIERLTYHCIFRYTDKIYLNNRLDRGATAAYLALEYWNALSEDERETVCQHILLDEKPSNHAFFDTRFLRSTNYLRSLTPKAEKKSDSDSVFAHDHLYDADDWAADQSSSTTSGTAYDDDEVEDYSTTLPGISVFFGQKSRFFYSKTKLMTMLSVEDVVLACTDYIAKADLHLKASLEDACLAMAGYIDARIRRKITTREKRIDALLKRLTVTTLQKRFFNGYKTGYPEGDPDAPLRLTNAEFPLFMMDLILDNILRGNSKKFVRDAPLPERSLRLKLVLQAADLMHALPTQDNQSIKKLGYSMPFSLNFRVLFKQIREKLIIESALSTNDVLKLNALPCKAINRLPLSKPDREMLVRFQIKRWENSLCLYQRRGRHDSVGVSMFDTLAQDNTLFELSLMALDSGIKVSRLRNLLRAIYEKYLPDAPPRKMQENDVTLDPVVHDILLVHEGHLKSFLTNWNKSAQFHTEINRIVDLMISQMGGAQGDHKHAFSHWQVLSRICGKEQLLTMFNPKSIRDIVALAKRDLEYVEKNKNLLAQLPKSVASQQKLIEYATHTVGDKSLYDYLTNPKISQHTDAKINNWFLPALHEAKQWGFNGLHVEILPADDLLGQLGVAASGVCIPFNGLSHLEHRTPAVANLIVRDDEKIWLWGLIIRVQNIDDPTYILNNLQGAFPSRYAKHKMAIKQLIRTAIMSLGRVYMRDVYFNALRILTEKEKNTHLDLQDTLIIPNMRLDIATLELEPNDLHLSALLKQRPMLEDDNVNSYASRLLRAHDDRLRLIHEKS